MLTSGFINYTGDAKSSLGLYGGADGTPDAWAVFFDKWEMMRDA